MRLVGKGESARANGRLGGDQRFPSSAEQNRRMVTGVNFQREDCEEKEGDTPPHPCFMEMDFFPPIDGLFLISAERESDVNICMNWSVLLTGEILGRLHIYPTGSSFTDTKPLSLFGL